MASPTDYILNGFQQLGQGLPQVGQAYQQQQELQRQRQPIPDDQRELLNRIIASGHEEVMKGGDPEMVAVRARIQAMQAGLLPGLGGQPQQPQQGMPPSAMPGGAPQAPSLPPPGMAPPQPRPMNIPMGPPGALDQGMTPGAMPQPSPYMQTRPMMPAPRSPVQPQMQAPPSPVAPYPAPQPTQQPQPQQAPLGMIPKGMTWEDMGRFQPFITEKMKADAMTSRTTEQAVARLELALAQMGQTANRNNQLDQNADASLKETQRYHDGLLKKMDDDARRKEAEIKRSERNNAINNLQQNKTFQRFQGYKTLSSALESVTPEELNDAPRGLGPTASAIRNTGEAVGLGDITNAMVSAGSSERARLLESKFSNFVSAFNQSRSGMVITPQEKVQLDKITNNSLPLSQRFATMQQLAQDEYDVLLRDRNMHKDTFDEIMSNGGSPKPDVESAPTTSTSAPSGDLSNYEDIING